MCHSVWFLNTWLNWEPNRFQVLLLGKTPSPNTVPVLSFERFGTLVQRACVCLLGKEGYKRKGTVTPQGLCKVTWYIFFLECTQQLKNIKIEHEHVACALAGICMEMKGKCLTLDRWNTKVLKLH